MDLDNLAARKSEEEEPKGSGSILSTQEFRQYLEPLLIVVFKITRFSSMA